MPSEPPPKASRSVDPLDETIRTSSQTPNSNIETIRVSSTSKTEFNLSIFHPIIITSLVLNSKGEQSDGFRCEEKVTHSSSSYNNLSPLSSLMHSNHWEN
ncbi:hypothetical protein JCM5353_002094 [Sporobolomyces roseus]